MTAKSVPVTYENNLLKIKIHQPDSKLATAAAAAVNSPFSTSSTTSSTLNSATEFRTPNLIIKKNQHNNNIEISTNNNVRNTASNLIDEIKINLNNNTKQNGLVYSRYVYSGKKDPTTKDLNNNTNGGHNNMIIKETSLPDSNYDSLTEDSAKYVQQTAKLRETSYQIDDLIHNKKSTATNQITSFHRF